MIYCYANSSQIVFPILSTQMVEAFGPKAKWPMQVRVLKPLSTANLVFSATSTAKQPTANHNKQHSGQTAGDSFFGDTPKKTPKKKQLVGSNRWSPGRDLAGLAAVLSALAVAQDHPLDAHVGQHLRRGFTWPPTVAASVATKRCRTDLSTTRQHQQKTWKMSGLDL